ncbi:hypothetical protein NQF86_00360 [Bombella sp. TMW 2.2543]|uniref:Uncharacterized protein n=1 Tax=Bombella pluederhausensis TaxID=2967336 RepID=A0ABT3WDF9_9PROT|nr:hypothetical protein [Bombella pluederhausensis]MCX5617125.1 hypothetical protein [Bombella pluederhausensis]
MYGAVTGKVALFAVVLILCLLSLTRTFFLMNRAGDGERFTFGTVTRIVTPFLFAYVVWWLLWH